jgi:hypothetical protein
MYFITGGIGTKRSTKKSMKPIMTITRRTTNMLMVLCLFYCYKFCAASVFAPILHRCDAPFTTRITI